MKHSFYDSPEYRTTQSEITARNQEKGLYEHLKKQVVRSCTREGCTESFTVQQKNPKQYCSQRCAAIVNNTKRRWPEAVKQKIASSLRGKENGRQGIIKVSRSTAVCRNPLCEESFVYERYKARFFCSKRCAMSVIGSQPTSPKASRGKAGIRTDVHPSIYFFSRWEANIARLYTFLGIAWVHSPRSFNIGSQMYTPDFYLPETDTYIEVKNFWNDYSRIRDEKFRSSHKHLALRVILKEEYLRLEKEYAANIPQWEYKNSPFVQTTSS